MARKAFSAYPKAYRPIIEKQTFFESINNWNKGTVFGAFNNTGKLCGYSYLINYCSYSELSVFKSDPEEEKNGINAALMDGILLAYNNKLGNDGFYLCDGARSIRHETNFQDYLEKYFGFRKAFCHMHTKYRWYVLMIIRLLGPFNSLLSRINSEWSYNISSLIEMDKLCFRE